MHPPVAHRPWLAALAAAAFLALFSASADAHGGGAKATVNVRVKNFRASPAAVAVANKNPTNFRGLASQQVTQFKVTKGTFVVRQPSPPSATYNTGSRKTIYIALTDTGIEDTTTQF